MKFFSRHSFTFRASALALGAALAFAVIPLSQAAVTPGYAHHFHIRGTKADAAANPAASAVFTCEVAAFTDPNDYCYGPYAIRKAYGADVIQSKGITGAGQTIVIIDAFGSPTAAADLAQFDAAYGLPPPPSFTVIHMPGSKPFDYTSNDQLGWAEESSLDTQWAHAIAPGAHIILLAAASDNDSDLIAAQNFAIEHGLGSIISESFGESEYDLITGGSAGLSVIAGYEAGYSKARQKNISVLVSAGDSGSSDPDTNTDGSPMVTFPVAAYPASSPNVTAVGGTNLFFGSLGAASPNGPYETESVWNDGFGAGGGGISAYFNTPNYQLSSLPASTLGVLNGSRGYPDIAYNAGVIGGVIVYLGFLGAANDGFYIFGGTSCGAPQWAGLTALMNQMAHHPLGFLNPRLYSVARGLGHDVIAGQNGFNTVPGYIAAPSWDLATGWGTPTAELLFRLSGWN